MNKFIFISIGALVVVVLLAIAVTSQTDIYMNQDGSSFMFSEGRPVLVTNIILGAYVSDNPEKSGEILMRTKKSYTTKDRLALRLTTAEGVIEPLQVNARLLTAEGNIIELSPSTLTFQPGTGTFCCWDAPPQPATYRLQIFRPERVITSIPFKVISTTF